MGQRPEYIPMWQEVQFYNQRIDTVLSVERERESGTPGRRLRRRLLRSAYWPAAVGWTAARLPGHPEPHRGAAAARRRNRVPRVRSDGPDPHSEACSARLGCERARDRWNVADRSGDCSLLRHRAPSRSPLRDVRPSPLLPTDAPGGASGEGAGPSPRAGSTPPSSRGSRWSCRGSSSADSSMFACAATGLGSWPST